MKLESVRELREKLINLEEKLMSLRDVQSSIAMTHIDGLPKAKSLDSSVEKIIAKIDEVEREIGGLQIELANTMLALTEEIYKRVQGREARLILHRRYVCCHMFKEIQADLHLSDARVFYLHRTAYKEFNAAA